MLGLGLEYAGIRIGICWDWDCNILGLVLGLEYAGIGIGICWDWDYDMLG
jgi:hypothetical protein